MNPNLLFQVLEKAKAGAMPFLPFLPRDYVVGIDLGASSIKMAQLVRREKGWALTALKMKEIPSLEDPEREKGIARALQELLGGLPLSQVQFVVCFDSPETCLRVMQVPEMPKRELQEALRLEAQRHFPLEIEKAVFDFDVQGQTTEGLAKKLELLVSAAERKTVGQIYWLFKKAGIRPTSLIPIPYALQKLAEGSKLPPNQIQGWLDLGDRHSELLILHGKQLIFSRKIPCGGRELTQAMTGVLVSDRGRMQLDWREAEKVKREVGFPQGGGVELIGEKISTTQITSMLRSPLEHLANEIDRCLLYYREETGKATIERLELFGRGAHLKGLLMFLSEALGIEVTLGDPVGRLQTQAQLVKPEEGFSHFAAAIGTALSQGKGINLLPPEIKQEIQRAFRRALIQSVAVGLVLMTALLYVGMKIHLGNLEKRIATAQFERASLGPALEQVRTQAVAHKILSQEPYWEDVFKELSNVIPRGAIYLTELSFEDGTLRLQGKILVSEKEAVLSRLILRLEEGIFKEVKLVKAEEAGDEAASDFELTARMA